MRSSETTGLISPARMSPHPGSKHVRLSVGLLLLWLGGEGGVTDLVRTIAYGHPEGLIP